jgi:hypothetical protein
MQVERGSTETRSDFPHAEPLGGARNGPVRIQIPFHRLTRLHSTQMRVLLSYELNNQSVSL